MIAPPIPIKTASVVTPSGPLQVGDLVTLECTATTETALKSVIVLFLTKGEQIVSTVQRFARVGDGEFIPVHNASWQGNLLPGEPLTLRMEFSLRGCGQLLVTLGYTYPVPSQGVAGAVDTVFAQCIRSNPTEKPPTPWFRFRAIVDGISDRDPDPEPEEPVVLRLSGENVPAQEDSCICDRQ